MLNINEIQIYSENLNFEKILKFENHDKSYFQLLE